VGLRSDNQVSPLGQDQIVSPPSVQALNNAALPKPVTSVQKPKFSHQDSLLQLLGQPSKKDAALPTVSKVAELSATPDQQPKAGKMRKEDELLSLLRQQNVEKSSQRPQAPLVKEGETAATINGPLNQPNFEAIARSHKEGANTMGRSPLTTHRTLFDPNQPVTMKIMARPQTPKETQAPGKSPRAVKSKVASSSPKRVPKSAKENAKPFQPQILRRPQALEERDKTVGGEHAVPQVGTVTATENGSRRMSGDVSSDKEKTEVNWRKPSQTESHKQTLLSLFGGGSAAGPKGIQTPSRVVSPLSTSQMISPKDEVPVSAIEPISTRSRVGSVTSVVASSTSSRPAVEKRATAADNKAFLLGYLGRLATQEG
jgi:hypothetical protein